MKRRRFLELAGLGVGATVITSKLAATDSTTWKAADPLSPTAGKAYGSGYFGNWIEDQFGMPAYQYTCNQITDPKAVSPVDPIWRRPADHTHQVGNDRLVAAVSNYGYVQVRQDEGSPKFLNDYYPEQDRYGGGIGFLADGETVLSTYYSARTELLERLFGIGYFRKRLLSDKYEIDQVIFAPFGDDPVLISQVTVTNHSDHTVTPRWVEYWGCHQYQFSYRALMESAIAAGAQPHSYVAISAADSRTIFEPRRTAWGLSILRPFPAARRRKRLPGRKCKVRWKQIQTDSMEHRCLRWPKAPVWKI
jgi:hypothetical protein